MRARETDGRGERGGAAIEMLLLLPFVILLNCFVIQLAHLFIAYQVVQYGAFAAARAALVADVNPADAPDGTDWKTKAAPGNEYDRPVRAAAQMCSVLELMAPPGTIQWRKNPIQFNVKGYSALPAPAGGHPAWALVRCVAAFASHGLSSPWSPDTGRQAFDFQAGGRSRPVARKGAGGPGSANHGAQYRFFTDDRAGKFLEKVLVALPSGPDEDEVRAVIVYDTFLPVPFANRIFCKAFEESGRGAGHLRVKVIQACTVVKPWM